MPGRFRALMPFALLRRLRLPGAVNQRRVADPDPFRPAAEIILAQASIDRGNEEHVPERHHADIDDDHDHHDELDEHCSLPAAC